MFREKELMQRATALKVNVGTDPSSDVGPVISKEVKTNLWDFSNLISTLKEDWSCWLTYSLLLKNFFEVKTCLCSQITFAHFLWHACFRCTQLLSTLSFVLFPYCLLISQVKDRINRLVQSSVDGGARLLLDERNIVVFIRSSPFVRQLYHL